MAVVHLQPGDIIIVQAGFVLTVAADETLEPEPHEKEAEPTKDDLVTKVGAMTLKSIAWPGRNDG
jgi:hypothetical protein